MIATTKSHVVEWKIRARWMLGQMLAKMERQKITGPGRGKKGGKTVSTDSKSFMAYIKALNLSKDSAVAAQRIGTLPKSELAAKPLRGSLARDRCAPMCGFRDHQQKENPMSDKEISEEMREGHRKTVDGIAFLILEYWNAGFRDAEVTHRVFDDIPRYAWRLYNEAADKAWAVIEGKADAASLVPIFFGSCPPDERAQDALTVNEGDANSDDECPF